MWTRRASRFVPLNSITTTTPAFLRLTWNPSPSPPGPLIDTGPRHQQRLRCSTRPGSTTPKGPRLPNQTSTRLFPQRLDINKHPTAACPDHRRVRASHARKPERYVFQTRPPSRGTRTTGSKHTDAFSSHLQKAEILRLRLGLANYKVRTGQTDVPLELLQMRPLPGTTTATTKATGIPKIAPAAAASNDAHRPATRRPLPGAPVRRRSEDVEVVSDSAGPSSQESGSSQEDDAVPQSRGGPVAGAAASRSTPLNRSPERLGLPRLPAQQQQQSAVHTPRRRHLEEADAERLTSSALRGGAANGLLSLARG